MSDIDHLIAAEVALARSVITYHGDASKSAAMDALYRQFIKPGDVAFDIGSHVGDRIASFRRLGATVVALARTADFSLQKRVCANRQSESHS